MSRQDILNREPFVENIKKIIELMLVGRKGGCFAIDGVWGSGKTFVLDMLEDNLRIVQDEESAGDKYFVFHYNCWEYDYYEEPSIAMVSMLLSLTRTYAQTIGTDAWKSALAIIEQMADNFIEDKVGIRPIETIGEIKDKKGKKQEHCFDKYFGFKDAIDKARTSIGEIANQKPVIVIVDELDRCNPQYAIRVLERLHHIFIDQDNVVLIIAVDIKQLEQSVKEIYGEGTDAERYLRKFIDFQLSLDKGTIQAEFAEKYADYFNQITYLDDHQKSEAIALAMGILNSSEIEIRNQEKIIEKAKTINGLLGHRTIGAKELVFEILLISCMFYTERLKNNEEKRISDLYYSFGWLPKITSRKRDLRFPSSFEDYLIKLVDSNTSTSSFGQGTLHYASSSIAGKVLYIADIIYNSEKQYFAQETMFDDMINSVETCKEIGKLALLLT